jgi:hypothetical protein
MAGVVSSFLALYVFRAIGGIHKKDIFFFELAVLAVYFVLLHEHSGRKSLLVRFDKKFIAAHLKVSISRFYGLLFYCQLGLNSTNGSFAQLCWS